MRSSRELVGRRSVALALAAALAAGPARAQEIRIDVPVALKEAKVVLNIDHRAFKGDEPAALQVLDVMVPYFKRHGTKARIVAVFHGDSGDMLLDDIAYDRARNWRGGNPYKGQIAALMRDGVEFEECGHTMALRKWSNADLLPHVKVNAGANVRILQLVQEGFVQLQP